MTIEKIRRGRWRDWGRKRDRVNEVIRENKSKCAVVVHVKYSIS